MKDFPTGLLVLVGAPFVLAFLVCLAVDVFSGPHREPFWFQAILASGLGILLAMVFQFIEEEAVLAIWQGALIAVATALPGAFCARSLLGPEGGPDRNRKVNSEDPPARDTHWNLRRAPRGEVKKIAITPIKSRRDD